MSANAWFKNIDTEDFEVLWNGRKRVFRTGEVKLLPEWFAAHCAKHLTNKLLLKSGDPRNESYTSPKKPEEVPAFMEIYNKCYELQGTREEAQKKDELDAEIELLNSAQKPDVQPETETEPAPENANDGVKIPPEEPEEEFEEEAPKPKKKK